MRFPLGDQIWKQPLGPHAVGFSVKSLQKAWVFTACRAECGAEACVLYGEIT